MPVDDRTRAIETAMSQLEKQFGKGSIMRLGSKEAIVPIAVISSGSISFDAALGVGGRSAWAGGGDLWAGELGQDNDHAADYCGGAADGRAGGVCGC